MANREPADVGWEHHDASRFSLLVIPDMKPRAEKEVLKRILEDCTHP